MSETSTFFQVPCYAVGLKSGAVCVVDQRTDSCNLTCPNASDYCIDCLKIHQDENYITSSNWNGKVFFLFFILFINKDLRGYAESLPFLNLFFGIIFHSLIKRFLIMSSFICVTLIFISTDQYIRPAHA